MDPSHTRLFRTGELRERIQRARALLNPCRLCPRQCGVNRLKDEEGACRTGRYARVASCYPHFGEEPELVGEHGSGTVFFQSCGLLCSFCQNYQISHYPGGVAVDPGQLAGLMLDLARKGCHNTYLNIMAQYRPCGEAARDPVIGRAPRPEEYRRARAEAHAAGLTHLSP